MTPHPADLPDCPHAETTLAWLYGEGDDDHAEHVAGCDACNDLIALHAEVAVAVAPIAPALAQETVERRRPTGRRAALALAASALLALGWWAGSPPADAPARVGGTEEPAHTATDRAAAEALAQAATLDLELDALQHDLFALSLDLETL